MPGARQRILEVLVAMTAERGLDHVSIREVARAASVSIGTVQYYCRSKDEMLRMTFDEVNSRIMARALDAPKDGLVGDALRRALLEFLPLDERRQVEAAVYLAFTARAAASAELADVRRAMLLEQHALCTDALRLAQDRGEAAAPFDPAEAGHAMVVVVDGLLMNLLPGLGVLSQDDALVVLDQQLRRFVRLSPDGS